jgi:hypothetical protein
MKTPKQTIFFSALMLIMAIASSAQVPYKIVGTGVTACYNNITTITCPTNPSDPFYGQDQGITPSYQDNGDGTISDLNTGLMWIKARGTKIGWDSAFIMAAQSTTGGHNDWRVPTIKESYSLINFNGKSAPTRPQCIAYIDTTIFGWTTGNLSLGERIIDAQDWSANKYTGLTMMADTTIFGVNFVDGRIKGYPKYQPPSNTTPQKMYVRYVRGNPAYGINAFVDNGDSTISDNATELMWSKNDSKSGMNWQSALAWVQAKNNANYCGHNDWRLPTAKELQSIVDYTRSKDLTNSAAIDPVFNITSITDEGGSVNWPFFWANTTHLDNMYGVYVAFGEALGYMKMPPTASYYTLKDVHGAGAQRSDPKAGSYTSYYLGLNQAGDSVYGQGPQGDVIRINNFVRLVRTDTSSSSGMMDRSSGGNGTELLQNYPNPFSNLTNIVFNLPGSENVLLTISDMTGREIRILVNGTANAGRNIIAWDGKNTDGRRVADGIYLYTLNTSEGIFTKLLIKN